MTPGEWLAGHDKWGDRTIVIHARGGPKQFVACPKSYTADTCTNYLPGYGETVEEAIADAVRRAVDFR